MRFKKYWKLYEFIDKNPNHSITELTNLMSWSRKRTVKCLRILHKQGIIKMKLNRYYSTPVKELINWDEMNFIKK